MARGRLSLVMGMEDTAMSTELLRDLLKDIMARDLLSLDMVTAQVSAITTEVPREFKDMAMEVITRDLLSLVMAITMDMDTHMFTRTVIIIMDLMVMRLIMIIRRDLLRLDMAMVVIATSMSTGLTLITRLRFIIHKHITMDMARDLLSLDMALLMFMLSRRTMDMVTLNPMNMDTTSIRDLLSLVMAITMDMDTLMFTRTVIIIMDLMDMRLIMIIRRDLLRLDMAMVVIATSMSTDHTLTTRLRFIIHKHITLDMALLMSMLSRRTMDMVTQSLTNMDTTSIKDLLNLDMDQMKVTKKFLTLHTPIMISKCTTLTRQIEIVPHFCIHAINIL